MCVSKVQHMMGRKTGCNRSRRVFWLFDFLTNLATRSLHSLVYSIWNGWIPTTFHGLHMDYFLAGNPAIFSFHTHYSIWNPYGMDHYMDIPCAGPCGFHVDSMEFPMNLHCKFMYHSIWIPWKNPHQILWKNHQLYCQK